MKKKIKLKKSWKNDRLLFWNPPIPSSASSSWGRRGSYMNPSFWKTQTFLVSCHICFFFFFSLERKDEQAEIMHSSRTGTAAVEQWKLKNYEKKRGEEMKRSRKTEGGRAQGRIKWLQTYFLEDQHSRVLRRPHGGDALLHPESTTTEDERRQPLKIQEREWQKMNEMWRNSVESSKFK